MMLDDLLRRMLETQGSDLHLMIGAPPRARVHGGLIDLAPEPATEQLILQAIQATLTKDQIQKLAQTGDTDGLYASTLGARFRVSVFRQMGTYSLVMRWIPTEPPTVDGLALPGVLKTIAQSPRGLILVTGTTGSGKSTSLAAMINHINDNESLNIITIEDPVEFTHPCKKSIIRQRQLGSDVVSYAAAMKYALRQDPDVILVGEMRDAETVHAALQAADTGHLVFSTLHTTNCQQTVERVLNFYPPDQQEQIRLSLSLNLVAVLSQRLLPLTGRPGRFAAVEIMVSTPTVRKLLREGKVPQLYATIEDGGTDGMQSFNQVLGRAFADGKVSLEVALEASSRPDELKLKLKTDGLI